MHCSQKFLVKFLRFDKIFWMKTPQDKKQRHSGTGPTTNVTTRTRDI